MLPDGILVSVIKAYSMWFERTNYITQTAQNTVYENIVGRNFPLMVL